MKEKLLVGTLMLVAMPALAKDQILPLAEADAAALQGKTVALTVHPRPSFVAMTAGKATFALFGVAAMTSAGNDLVDSNKVADPAGIVRDNMSAALHDAFGAQLLAVDTKQTEAKKPKDIAALHPEADYVLDVRSGGWNYGYFASDWDKYWVGYSVQVQLIDTKAARQVSNLACTASTQQNPQRPSRDQLHANGAQLLKDVTAALGWLCVQMLAKEQFRLPADKIPAIPTTYFDPLAALAPRSAPQPVMTQEVPPAGPSSPASQSAPVPATTDAPQAPKSTATEIQNEGGR